MIFTICTSTETVNCCSMQQVVYIRFIIIRRVMRDVTAHEPLAGILCSPNHVIALPGANPCYRPNRHHAEVADIYVARRHFWRFTLTSKPVTDHLAPETSLTVWSKTHANCRVSEGQSYQAP